MNLKAIKTIRKTGKEQFTINDEALSFSLLDFWKWNLSEIMGNAARGKLAEFIVGTAIGIGHENVREEWDAFDLQTKEGIKIVIKTIIGMQVRFVNAETGSILTGSGSGEAVTIKRSNLLEGLDEVKFNKSTIGIATKKALESASARIVKKMIKRGIFKE